MKSNVMYCVMVNDEMYPGSLCYTKEGATSYLSDARRAGKQGELVLGRKVRVYVARLRVTKVRPAARQAK